MSITRISQFQAMEGKSHELHDFLNKLVPYILASPGCLSCEALQSAAEPDQFVMLEKWISPDAHASSVELYPRELMQKGMALLGSPPKGGFFK